MIDNNCFVHFTRRAINAALILARRDPAGLALLAASLGLLMILAGVVHG
ncbi:MAG: hypothetical protein ACEB74_04880 [Desulfovibrio aminophilus]